MTPNEAFVRAASDLVDYMRHAREQRTDDRYMQGWFRDEPSDDPWGRLCRRLHNARAAFDNEESNSRDEW